MTYTIRTFSSIVIALAAVCAIVSGCGRKSTPARLNRLDLALADGSVPADSAMHRVAVLLFAASGYGPLTPGSAQTYATLPSITAHSAAVAQKFAETDAIEAGLGSVKTALGQMLPDVHVPGFYAIISPFNQSIIMADTVMFIGLNHYLGYDYEPYGYFPQHQRVRKEPRRIPLDVAEAIVRTAFPYTPTADGGTHLLSHMLYEGAVAYAVASLADTDTDTAIGYTDAEKKWLHDNTRAAWQKIVEERMLFSSDPAVERNLLTLSPASTMIAPDAPGATGRHIGAEIVKSYAENHSGASLSAIIDLYKSPSALSDSGW